MSLEQAHGAVGDESEQALALELSRIAELPVSERAAAFSQLHGQLGQLLESTPVTLFEGTNDGTNDGTHA